MIIKSQITNFTNRNSGLNTNKCTNCGNMFIVNDDERWKKKCLSCFINDSESYRCIYCMSVFKGKKNQFSKLRKAHCGKCKGSLII